jgi:type II secretory pathway predicted ATPase ExeA
MKFFGFINTPFFKGMPSSCLFLSDGQDETLSRLAYITENNMFGVITGECGTGKSTILRKLKDSLDEKKYEFLYVTDSKLTPRHFYNGLLSQLGRDGAFYRGDARRRLHQEIEIIHGVRRREIVIVVDEAHLLDREMLEELRFLLNFKMDSESPLALILSGQPELEETLDRRSSMAIRQRIDFSCRLSPLSLEETGEYIKHHLSYAGGEVNVFSEEAIKSIFSYSSGSPRLINKACNCCLMFGVTKQIKTIDENIAKEIIEHELK